LYFEVFSCSQLEFDCGKTRKVEKIHSLVVILQLGIIWDESMRGEWRISEFSDISLPSLASEKVYESLLHIWRGAFSLARSLALLTFIRVARTL